MRPFPTNANPSQLAAIAHDKGPLLIIAGPGSGKTFTLVERVVYLITQKLVAPEHILIVTFTDKAASELRTRISNRLNELGVRFNLNEMYLGTFHSVGLRLLEEHRDFTRLKRNYTLLDEFDQQYFLYQRLGEYRGIKDIAELLGDPKETSSWTQSEALKKWVNKVAEEGLEIESLRAAPEPEVRALGECCRLYRQQLDDENALDFSTIQYETLTLLRAHESVKRSLREQFKFVMVDEYQDTNTIQELILKELAGEEPNLCVVGDDDQGLYRFRGATIRNILEFRDQFPKDSCQQVKLTVNYRSHPDIVTHYNWWMGEQDWSHEGKEFRLNKVIVPREDEFPSTPTVLKVSSNSEQGWHDETLAFLRALKERGGLTDWNQVAFLFRSVKNKNAVALARALEDNGIPVYSPRSNMFFEREEIRLVIGALIFLFPQFPEIRKWKPDAELRIWDYYDEHCVKPFIEQLRLPENKSLLKWIRPLAQRHKALTQNTDYTFAGLFFQLLQFPLFSRYLGDGATGNVREGRAARNLALLSQLLGKFEYLHHISVLQPKFLDKNVRDLFNQFFRYLQDGGINEYEDVSEYAPSGCVSFLTIHQSKGLEFPVVVVGSLDAVPRKQYTELDEILEHNYFSRPPLEPMEMMKFYDFWRLYYTAFSRAQNLLVLTCQEKTGRWRVPSKYLAECFNRALDWRDAAFRPEELRLEHVKDVSLKREYSFTSHITLFENCAEQYRFFRELEFAPIRNSPILFGNLVHQTIEDVHKTVLRGQPDRVNEEQIASWFEVNYAALTKKERVYLSAWAKNAALEQVLRYVRREGNDWSRLREAEVDISLVKDQYILRGSVDLIRGEGDTVEIIDFKTEKKPDIHGEREKLDRYKRQLEVYAHIVEERTGLQVSRTHLYYTSEESGNPYITFPKDNRAIGETIAAFDAVVARIEGKDFAIIERPKKLCGNCDMRHYCDGKEKRI